MHSHFFEPYSLNSHMLRGSDTFLPYHLSIQLFHQKEDNMVYYSLASARSWCSLPDDVDGQHNYESLSLKEEERTSTSRSSFE